MTGGAYVYGSSWELRHVQQGDEVPSRVRQERLIQMFNVQRARILIVDDEPVNVGLLEQMLFQSGFCEYRSTYDAREALAIVDRWDPQLVILDLLMPGMDGFEFLEILRERFDEADILLPVLVVTADSTRTTRTRALGLGAKDFLTKPLDYTEVTLRVTNLLETRYLYEELRRQNEQLAEKVEKVSADLAYREQQCARLGTEQHDLLLRLHDAKMHEDPRSSATRSR